MSFEEILDAVLAMLQRRGRVTYGALKRQFQLDDAYVEDLKAELIEGQRLAVDGPSTSSDAANALLPMSDPQIAPTRPRAPRSSRWAAALLSPRGGVMLGAVFVE